MIILAGSINLPADLEARTIVGSRREEQTHPATCVWNQHRYVPGALNCSTLSPFLGTPLMNASHFFQNFLVGSIQRKEDKRGSFRWKTTW